MKTLLPSLSLVALLMLGGCTAKPQAAPSAAHPVVEVATAVQKDVPVYGEWVGTLNGYVNADVKAQVAGNIVAQTYHEGDHVHQGQILFEIDPRPFEAALAQARASESQARGQRAQAEAQLMQAQALIVQANSQLIQAQAGRAQAVSQLSQTRALVTQAQANQRRTQLDANKYSQLHAEQFVTQQEYDNALTANEANRGALSAARAQVEVQRGAVRSADAVIGNAEAAVAGARAQAATARGVIETSQAQIAAAQAQVQTAELNLKYAHVTSPIDGIAGIAAVQVGNLVGPTTAPLATVSTVNPMKVDFTITESEYMEAAGRDAAPLRTKPFELLRADGTAYPNPGRFVAEDRNVGVTTGSIRITIRVPNADASLRPGQYARVRAVRYVLRNAVLVPQRAVSELQDTNQVAVVGPDNKVTLRAVKLGPRIGSDWVVLAGVKGGERVVAEGVQKAGADAVVDPKPYVTPSPAASASPGTTGKG